jgi:Pentapeptide repeats (8 copies)
MPNEEHLKRLREGVDGWNAWIVENHIHVDLSSADLRGTDLSGAILTRADLRRANLSGANLNRADFKGADLRNPTLNNAQHDTAELQQANLREASLKEANLFGAYLQSADLRQANLRFTNLIDADLTDADLTGCLVFGTNVWNVKLDGAKQRDLVITQFAETEILTVDNIEVAQVIHVLLNNTKMRDVIDTVGQKAVLLLGRFTEGRIAILDRLRYELRKRGYLPVIFNFDKPKTRDFTETVRLLAGLSKFVIADITNPRSAPLELQATVPDVMVPIQPIIEDGETAFAMLEDLQRKHDWVFQTLRYSSLDRLIETMDEEIIKPAEAKFKQLLARRAERIEDRLV